jgi:hypothetical protein
MTFSLESQKEFRRECEEMALRAIRVMEVALIRGKHPSSAEVRVSAGFLIRLLKKHITITVDSTTGTAQGVSHESYYVERRVH